MPVSAKAECVRRLFFMGIGELLLLAVGVSMDAFAVSIAASAAVMVTEWILTFFA